MIVYIIDSEQTKSFEPAKLDMIGKINKINTINTTEKSLNSYGKAVFCKDTS